MTTAIEYGLDPNLYKYDRTAYSLLDYLRDIGGLFSSLNAFFSAIVFILNYNGMYFWLTSSLFKV